MAQTVTPRDSLEPTTYRTHSCGALRAEDEGAEAKLCGWVNSRRDHGGLIFVDLRDRSGKVQVVFSPERDEESFRLAETLRSEHVIQVVGIVARRASEMVNPKLATGEVEVNVRALTVLSRAETPPFEVDGRAASEGEGGVAEETRLRWRFIDLRRPRVQEIMAARHRAVRAVREDLSSRGFLEVETPLLGKSTPEGARDYLVPSRLSPGTFYALPQSPQLYKQLLMVAGFDRYFQIARCLRDEDLRADRQPEFTQVDVEMGFASFEDVADVTERLMCAAFRDGIGVELPRPFPRTTYADCVRKYGDDKPDLRYGIELQDAADFARSGTFPPFTRACDTGGTVRAIRGQGWGGMSRKELENLTGELHSVGAPGLGWMRVKDGSLAGGIAKNFPDEAKRSLVATLGADDEDMALLVGGGAKATNAAMAYLRNRLGADRGWKKDDEFALTWVTDFPLFTQDEETGRWASEHHPFTSPNLEDTAGDRLESDPGSVRSLSYDLVLNGYEVASGSVRIHDSDLQTRVFNVLQLEEDEIERKFGFFRSALRYGAPPHAGIAVGVDRVIAVMVGASSIREVIAFPKTQRGGDLMTGAPSEVDARQLRDLGISVLSPKARVASGPSPEATRRGNAGPSEAGRLTEATRRGKEPSA